MFRVLTAALESATGTTAEVARIQKAMADVPTPFTSIEAHGPAALKTIMPGHGVLAAPMRDIKSDWKRWSQGERIGAIAIIATFTIIYGLTLVEALAG